MAIKARTHCSLPVHIENCVGEAMSVTQSIELSNCQPHSITQYQLNDLISDKMRRPLVQFYVISDHQYILLT